MNVYELPSPRGGELKSGVPMPMYQLPRYRPRAGVS